MQIIVCKPVHLLRPAGNGATKPKPGAAAGTNKMLRHAGRIMKLLALFILVACLQIHATGLGQGITLTVKDAPIESVFKQVQKQTDYKFLYTSQLLEGAAKVSLSVKNASVKEVLDECFKGQKLDYEIQENMIVVRPKINVQEHPSELVTTSGPIEISGKVTNGEGRPLAGANVKIRGTNIGVTTDNNGNFVIKNVSENAILEISFVGHEMKTFIARKTGFFNITLEQKLSLLDETVVIAYGTTTRRFATGNVANIKSTDIEKQPVNNPLLALQGRVAGLFITQNTGVPGGGITIRIQGQNSIRNGSDPFYVIDGIPFSSQLESTGNAGVLGSSGGLTNGQLTGGGNPLSFINPDDIESIDILKDADATAIYGSRAANGAILITTKKGKNGKTKVDINFQKGIGTVSHKMEMLHTDDYLEMRKEAKKNSNVGILSTDYDINGTWDATSYTDWQKELIGGSANYNNISASISGGNAGLQYRIGSTYHRETTVFPCNYTYDKASTSLSLNGDSYNKRFHFQVSANYIYNTNKLPSSDLTGSAVLLEPNAPKLYNVNGELNWMPNGTGISTWTNPLASAIYNSYQEKSNNLISNALLSYKILPKFEVSSNFGYTNTQTNDFLFYPLAAVKPELRTSTQRTASYGNRNLNSYIIEPQATYKTKLGLGKIDILLGVTFQQNNSTLTNLKATGFNSDVVMKDIKSATSYTVLTSSASVYKYNALFGRLNYNWDDKYIVNVTARRDGSTRFGSENQIHNFGAIGLAWVFSNEKFVKQNLSFISFGKIRVSYGTTGNDQIGDFQFLNLYSPPVLGTVGVPYQNVPELYPNGLTNPYLEWEETRKFQLGSDFGFLKDRIVVNVTFALNRSSNQLLPYALPNITGFGSVTDNFPATVQNTSWEFTLSSTNVKFKDFYWNTNINLTIPRNKLIAFPDLQNSSYSTSLFVGQPILLTRVYHLLGVDQTTGKYIVANSNGDPTSSPNSQKDRNLLVSKLPIFYGGIQNSFNYKGFSLEFLFQFIKQKGPNSIFSNGTFSPGNFFSGFSNQPVSVLNRWQKPGDVASVQVYNSTSYSISNATLSDANYTDASFIRLKNISLSKQLSEKLTRKIHLQSCVFYIHGQNLFTVTNYKGLDPETQSLSILPPLRIITFGLQLSL